MLRIREIRKNQNMNQETLAAKIGMSQSNISEIENGIHNPTLQTLARIAHALNCELSELFSESPREQNTQRIIEALSVLDDEEREKIAAIAEMIAAAKQS
ncbi:MAG: helix-turn-helix transcriptional regulator [Pseudomonadota bacterium]